MKKIESITGLPEAASTLEGMLYSEVSKINANFTELDQKITNVNAAFQKQLNGFNESMVGRFTELEGTMALTFTEFNKRLDELWAREGGTINPPIDYPVDSTHVAYYGAVGQGADETEQLLKCIAENDEIHFSPRNYRISKPLVFSGRKTVYFNGATIEAHGFIETAIQITGKIDTHGTVYIDGRSRATNGFTVVGGGRSLIDSIRVTKCRVWGIFVDRAANNNLVYFNQIGTYQNGTILSAVANRGATSGVMELTNMDCKGWDGSRYNTELINNVYSQFEFIVDATGYDKDGNGIPIKQRRVFMTDYNNSQQGDAVIQNPEDQRSATVRLRGHRANNINDDYVDKNIQVLLGGGACFYKKAEGAININQFGTSSNPVGLSMGTMYGGFIGNFVSQYDNLMIGTDYIMGLSIGHLYMEATSPKLFEPYKKKLLLCTFYDKTEIVAISSIGSIKEENVAVIAGNPNNYPGITIMTKVAKSFYGQNISPASHTYRQDYDEQSNRNVTQVRNFHNTTRTLTLDRQDVEDTTRNGFTPMTFYFSRSNDLGKLRIGLSEKLVTAGYIIRNASEDGTFSMDVNTLPREFKATIILFGKEFVVVVEGLTQILH